MSGSSYCCGEMLLHAPSVTPRYNLAMHISDEALDEFIAIYKKEFRKKLTREEARTMATEVLRLYVLLSRTSDGDAAQRNVPE